ncbi:MAG: DNA-3-methyladenine glycosylase 2 [Gammaproteobacteria bacterium]|nr:DNA-3-methyladenine glycosylase 2 [Gammaproteobacteria bacterium]
MWMDHDVCCQALAAHDARFDGRFFVGVTSTGIYCRPVCRTRRVKPANCRFYPSAAAAEAQGFRPCLRCRPELAPGHASVDAPSRLAQAAANLIENGACTNSGIGALAERLGTTDRHLRRVFAAEFGVAPVAYMQTQRLLLAKRLLTDTSLPVTEVAMAAGFGSLRRFNALFRERYRLQPRGIRKTPESAARDRLEFELAYRPPYAWTAQLAFLTVRATEGVEAATAKQYRRTVAVEHGKAVHRGWIEVAHRARRHTLQVTMSGSLALVVPVVLGRVKQLFDLGCRPDEIERHLGGMASSLPGLRVPGAFDGFEMAVRAVLGQQITVAAARTLAGRITRAFGEPIATPFMDLTHTFPTPERLAAASGDELGRLGVTRSRQRAIRGLAEGCASGKLDLIPTADVEQTLEELRSLPGIGEWTAQYIAMRALGWPDAFPHGDHAVKKALGETSARRVLARAESWRPWRAYATMHLWNGAKV